MVKAAKKTPVRKRQLAQPATPADDPVAFPIVGVGASAGGIQSFTRLISRLPERPGIAIIFVLHAVKHESALAEVMRRNSKVPVVDVTSHMKVRPNHIYLAPADSEIVIQDGVLTVNALGRSGDYPMPIDFFLQSLGADQGIRAIGILLSGAGSDGTLGLKSIKGEGGITFAEDDTAQFSSMPRSAIAAGAVDFILSADEISRELVRLARQGYLRGEGSNRLPEAELTKIFRLLQSAHDVDFTHYKQSTVERRIRRRMALQKVDSLEDYVALLRDSGMELEQLYADILIRVTGFFRDPEVFATLRKEVFPAMLREHSGDLPLRVWVPGCATGEEVYSIAMCLFETAHELKLECPIQVFGTDVSELAVEKARAGIYPENIAAEVGQERLRQFFTRVDGGYRIAKSVRDSCIFARQNLTKDPPFSRLDLISCRNVMIYLGAVLQKKVMAIFHYALRPTGYLLLGSSETIGSFGDLFTSVDRRHKLYQKRSALSRTPIEFESLPPRTRGEVVRVIEDESAAPGNVFREADRVLLGRFSPPGVLVNDKLEILQFRGRTSPYLEPAPGAASFNILKMAKEGLLAELRTAIHSARKKETSIRRQNLRVQKNGGTIGVNIEVVPFLGPNDDRYFLVLFSEVVDTEPRRKGKKAPPEVDTRQSMRLKRELDSTREYLQSIIEEQEAMNEELRSANEEIQSSNEELQSTNEELETAKEELQSSNEELTTLNEELENRATELSRANNDLVNLLASVDIPIVMLDAELRIRRFNPGAQRILNLIPSDIGRAMSDMKMALLVDDLEDIVGSVIQDLEVRELEVRDRGGRTYMLRIRPYKTTENKIEGAVLVLIDIDQIRARK